MAKMLRARKQFGRCHVPGHGSGHFDHWYNHVCEVVDEIQNTPFTRAQDKREWKTEIEMEIEDDIEIWLL